MHTTNAPQGMIDAAQAVSDALSEKYTKEINEGHAEIAGDDLALLDKYIAQGKRLTDAKAALGHGDWLKWIADHYTFEKRQAQIYMRFYRRRDDLRKAQSIALFDDQYGTGDDLPFADPEPVAVPDPDAPPPAAPEKYPPRPKPKGGLRFALGRDGIYEVTLNGNDLAERLDASIAATVQLLNAVQHCITDPPGPGHPPSEKLKARWRVLRERQYYIVRDRLRETLARRDQLLAYAIFGPPVELHKELIQPAVVIPEPEFTNA